MKRFQFVYLTILFLFLGCATNVKLPGDADSLLSLGKNALSEGKYNLAAKAFERFTLTFPTHPKAQEAQFLLAESYYKKGDWTDAISEYRFLLDNYPSTSYREAALFYVASAYLKKSPPSYLDQTETERAVEMLRDFLSTFPNSEFATEARKRLEEAKDKLAQHMLIAADTYIKLGHYDSAKIFLEELIKRYPTVPTALKAKVVLAETLIKLGENEKALLTLNEVIDSPNVPDSLKQSAYSLKKILQ